MAQPTPTSQFRTRTAIDEHHGRLERAGETVMLSFADLACLGPGAFHPALHPNGDGKPG
ncbi:hypothetical protein J2X98_002311 [Pseudarthrobacter enclensis]|uniref:Uncharacterized protein n=1 Tax=Pseudarthrobacter enclensis TaxID=993070 RepID=A0ABT9RTZ8_9MICC|nr:hypothetical protein [Pseudarthrobacter enclensis]